MLTSNLKEEKKNVTSHRKKKRKLITSTRQSCWMRRLIQRVPGIGFVLTTLYFPFGFHTSMDTGLAMRGTMLAVNSLASKLVEHSTLKFELLFAKMSEFDDLV